MNTSKFTAYLEKAIDYTSYKNHIDSLLAQNKTTGDNHSEDMIHYTKMNVTRMNRLEKTVSLSDELMETLNQLNQKQTWLVITEAWCGDAAQIVPIINKMAEVSPKIELKLVYRDENLDLMDQYLTNGGRSIPKLISIDAETGQELFNWGPRPVAAQKVYNELKATHTDYMKIAEGLHLWYAKDKTKETQKEFVEILTGG
jgi:hypothetical protein